MNNLVTLAIFTYRHEYAVLQLLLEQENIQHFFQNETMIGVFPFYSNALGGIQLKVHPLDVDRAREIINSFNQDPAPLKIV
jgi:hypothetical protein